MPITWSDDLITGIAVIDEQHQKLFEIIQKFDKFENNEGVLYAILIDIMTYVATHFKTEEEYMLNANYSDLSYHKSCHEEFIREFKKFLNSPSQSVSLMQIAPDWIKYAEKWIIKHYTNEDVKMAKFLREADNFKL